MRFLMIGVTGRIGSLVVEEALSRGHTVTALVRNPDAIQPKEGLTVVKGTPVNKADIASVFKESPTAAITALGHNHSSSGPHYMADVHTKILAAMRAHGIRKLVVLQALGVGESKPNLFFAMRWMIKCTSMARHFADHDLVDEMVRKEVEVIAVRARPTRLEGGENQPVVFNGNDWEGYWWVCRDIDEKCCWIHG